MSGELTHRRRKRRRGATRLVRAGDLVGDLLDTSGARRGLREHRVALEWRQIVGARISRRTLPDGLAKGVLWVRVSSSAWMHELSFLKHDLLARINGALGDPPLISEVRFHLGARSADADDALAPTLSIRRPPLARRQLPAPASGKKLDEIDAETQRVQDCELRDIIRETRRKLGL